MEIAGAIAVGVVAAFGTMEKYREAREKLWALMVFFFWSQRAPPSISSKETANSFYKEKCTSNTPQIT
jgi:hypothetical protein